MFKKLLLTALLSVAMAVPALAAEYSVDKDHSNVGFQVRHMLSKVNGEFTDFESNFIFDDKKIEDSKGTFVVKTASINTRNQKRDDHLRSPDFFDSKKFPEMTFKSKKVTKAGDKNFKLEGDLTIKGVTKPVTFDGEYLGIEKDPWGNTRAAFTAKTKINRKDYGLNWNKTLESGGLLVGDDVEISLNVEAVQKGAAPAKK